MYGERGFVFKSRPPHGSSAGDLLPLGGRGITKGFPVRRATVPTSVRSPRRMTPDPRPPSQTEQHLNLYEMATAQFHRAADAIELDSDTRSILCQPKNEIITNFPV